MQRHDEPEVCRGKHEECEMHQPPEGAEGVFADESPRGAISGFSTCIPTSNTPKVAPPHRATVEAAVAEGSFTIVILDITPLESRKPYTR